MHLIIVGGSQFSLQVRDVLGDDLGEVRGAHLAKHMHWEDCLGMMLVETGLVEDGCECNVSVVLQHLVCDNIGVLDQFENVLNDVHVGNLDVVGQGHQHLGHLDNVELVGHNHFLELVHSNHVLERLQNGSRLFSSKVLNIVEGLCDVSELFYNLHTDSWSHWHKFAIGSEHMVGGV